MEAVLEGIRTARQTYAFPRLLCSTLQILHKILMSKIRTDNVRFKFGALKGTETTTCKPCELQEVASP